MPSKTQKRKLTTRQKEKRRHRDDKEREAAIRAEQQRKLEKRHNRVSSSTALMARIYDEDRPVYRYSQMLQTLELMSVPILSMRVAVDISNRDRLTDLMWPRPRASREKEQP